MKKLFTLTILAALFSCADENSSDNKTYDGNFLMVENSAVLEVDEQMYTVSMNELTEQLAAKVKESQKTEFDMVPVTIEAVVAPKPVNTEGWDSILTIKKIIAVSPTAIGPDIQIEETNQ